jgi:predicted ATPase with chaperone activity
VLQLGLLLGIIPFDELALVGGMASALGGVVMLGSNNSTAKAASSELAEANAARAALIGRIELRVVESPPTLH